LELEIISLAATLPGIYWNILDTSVNQIGMGYRVESSGGIKDRSYCPLLLKAGNFSPTVPGRISWASYQKFL